MPATQTQVFDGDTFDKLSRVTAFEGLRESVASIGAYPES
jgi:hypothetical protein